MSRESLMAQQRARMEARRKRLAEQKKKEQAKAKAKKTEKKAAPAKSRPLLSKDAPLTGDAAKKRLGIKPKGKAGAPAGKVPATAKPSKPAKPAASNKGKERFFAGGKGGKYDTGSFFDGAKGGPIDKALNKEKAKSNFFAGAKGGKFDAPKPKRSNFPAGRGGAAKYAEALRKYNASNVKPKVTKKYNRRGREIK